MAVLPVGIGPVTGYQIQRSLRFNSADSAYLNRTPASAGNRKTWTWSGWVKRTKLGATAGIFEAANPSWTSLSFGSDDKINFQLYDNPTYNTVWATTAVFRDPSAWYHIVLVLDTTQASQTNMAKLYVNGVQQTFTYTNYNSAIPQNSNWGVNYTAIHYLGTYLSGSPFNGYMTEINFIDGQALTPSSFGQTDPSTGVWQPIKYTGTYGTNGFYLNFSDNSGTTATTLGKDSSGNGNNWTPNNFSVTAGAGNDSLVDTPTPYGTDTGAGGEVRGNYCTLNPLSGTGTLANGNLDFSGTSGNSRSVTIAFPTSGKWYCEVQITSTPENNTNELVGITGTLSDPANVLRAYASNGQYYNGSAWVSFGSAWSQNDVIGVAADIDSSQLSFYKNGVLQGSAQSYTFPNGSGLTIRTRSSGTSTFVSNFGQRPFAYTAPSGFKALCTQNLPTPTIGATSTTTAGKYFNAVLWTGDGASTRSISGVGFQPDFVWIKVRSNSFAHTLNDVIRGAGSLTALYSSSTSSEAGGNADATNGYLSSFDSDGFSVARGSSTTQSYTNQNTWTYVAWQWNAGGSNATNTSGSITSTVRANTTAGFSIVSYTGNGTGGATVGHGLGVAPSMIIIKVRSGSGDDWGVYHSSLGNTGFLALNTTAANTTSNVFWNSTSPTSTLFTLGTNTNVNRNTYTHIAYCFAAVAGYSAFGSYTGNGSTDGPFVYTGFRPRFILMKRTSSTSNWIIRDSVRLGYNAVDTDLYADLSNAEATPAGAPIDFVSNGFKLRGTGYNGNGENWIYAAFAESPFKYSLAR